MHIGSKPVLTWQYKTFPAYVIESFAVPFAFIYSWIDRFVDREAAIGESDSRLHYRAALFILLTVYVTEGLCNAIFLKGGWIGANYVEAFFVPAATAITFFTPFKRVGCALLAGAALFRVISTFPVTANHNYLLFVLFTLFAISDPENDDERNWLLGSLKLIFLFVFFYTGLQKLLHGYYANGELFALAIATSRSFEQVFALVLPSAEMERLTSLTMEEGQGPFRLQSPLGVLISRGAYTAELVLPIAFLKKSLRTFAVAATFIILLLIESAAREYSFGLYFVNLALLFLGGRWHWNLRYVFLGIACVLITLRILGAFQIIPGAHFG